MTNTDLNPTMQKVLDFLWQNHGQAYAASDVCEVVDCSTSQAQVALDALTDTGLVERQESTVATLIYTARQGKARS